MSYSPPTYFHPLDQHAWGEACRTNPEKSRDIWKRLNETVQLAGTTHYADGTVHYEVSEIIPDRKTNWCNTEWSCTGTYYQPHPEDDHVLCVTNNKIDGFTIKHLRYKDTLKLVHEEWSYRGQRYLGEEELSNCDPPMRGDQSIFTSCQSAQYQLKFQAEAIERNARREAGLSSDVCQFNSLITTESPAQTSLWTTTQAQPLSDSASPSILTQT